MTTNAATILNETTISLAQAAKRLPSGRKGAPVSLACILRWILDGSRSPDGRLVKLEAIRLGGRWLTSEEALARFADRLTPQADNPTTPPRTRRQQRQAAVHAGRELERLGS